MNTKKKQRNNYIGPIIFIIFFIIAIAIYCFTIYRTIVNKKEITNVVVMGIVFLIVLALLISNYYANKLRPKASPKWREIEHGSNEFQTKEEREEFIENCTDEQIALSEKDIERILLFIGERK